MKKLEVGEIYYLSDDCSTICWNDQGNKIEKDNNGDSLILKEGELFVLLGIDDLQPKYRILTMAGEIYRIAISESCAKICFENFCV